jgi:hypothetical protein
MASAVPKLMPVFGAFDAIVHDLSVHGTLLACDRVLTIGENAGGRTISVR